MIIKCVKCGKDNRVAGLGAVETCIGQAPDKDEVHIYCGFCGDRRTMTRADLDAMRQSQTAPEGR